ncbi:MAG: histidinol-phosphate transaminase [Chloroflexota bacterium]
MRSTAGADVPSAASLIRPDVASLAEYTPVEPVAVLAARLGVPPAGIAKLDGNENPYGPSPLVKEAVARASFRLYPDPFHTELREAVAGYAGVDAGKIMFGNGSDELLELVIRLLLEPGDSVIDCAPSFGMYGFLPPLFMGRVVTVRRDAQFGVDVDRVLRALEPRTKLILLASPNNPTGNVLPDGDLCRLLESGRIVLVDEAYVEFASSASAVRLADTYPNLIVLRTFSKWAGLAGLRAGWGVFSSELIQHLWKIKQPYNVNVAAAAAVLASLEDREVLLANVRKIVAERERMAALLSPHVRSVYPSQANFLLCRLVDGPGAKDALRSKGIVVRSYSGTPGLEDCLRISVGLPSDTDRVIEVLAAL